MWLQYLQMEKVPGRYQQFEPQNPPELCDDEKQIVLLDTILDLLRSNQLSNLRLLALYSPPALEDELL